MAKKKNGNKGNNPQPARKSSGSTGGAGSRNLWIVAALVIGGIALLVALAGGSSDSPPATATGTSPAELDYVGRFLPAGYTGPTVADRTLYTTAVQMTNVPSTQEDSVVSVSLDSVLTDKIVKFEYTRSDGEILPMIAYVKPSGGLFVGVSYCPPCEGEGQRIEGDGTLTCEACGTKRNLETNEGISGACKLYPLDEVPATVVGDQIIVDGTVMDAWTAQPLDRPVG